MRSHAFLVVLTVLLAGCIHENNSFDASGISTEWSLVRNVTNEKPIFRASLTLVNNGDQPVPSKGWRLYMSLRYHGYQLISQSMELDLKHVSGDLFYIEPTANFSGLKPAQTLSMDYTGERRIANYQDVPSGMFWVNRSDTTSAIQLPAPVVAWERSQEKVPDAEGDIIYTRNKLISDIAVDKLPRVFPTARTETAKHATFYISDRARISTDTAFSDEATYLSDELKKLIKSSPDIPVISGNGGAIELRHAALPAEHYHLSVANNRIMIEAGSPSGIFYGIQSLKTMMAPATWRMPQDSIEIPGIDVIDGPRFPVREFMLDVARNFQSKERILKTLEIMSLYKLNVFHFHLTDDEGWRIEIPGLPELTGTGSERGFPFADNKRLHPAYGSGSARNESGTGHYSVSDYIEIVRYATARHITVVPEIESPGHARAAILAMQARYDKFMEAHNEEAARQYLLSDPDDQSSYRSNQYFNDNVMNVAMPSTYAFIGKVADELIGMHRKAGAPLTAIHVAGDEVPFGSWEKSPAVAAFRKSHPGIASGKDLWRYYFDEMKRMLRSKHLALYGWQELVVGTQTRDDGRHEVLPDLASTDLQIDAWWNMDGNEDVPYQLPNAGYKTILTCFDYFYFDLAYTPSFREPGDAWIGFLDIDKIFSFIPYDYFRNNYTDLRGNPNPTNFAAGKVALQQEARGNIVGIQGALWGENMISGDLMEYMLVPRLLALAERAWAKDPSWATEKNEAKARNDYQKDWSKFANVLGKRELPRLDFYPGKIRYRIPTPGATAEQGNVVANIQLPGFSIRYTHDGSEPNEASTLYTAPIPDKGVFRFRAFDLRGRGSLPVIVVNQ